MSIITESPRGNCALGGANALFSAINKIIPIYHSGPGCCMQTTAGEAGQAGGRHPYYVSGVSLPCSNMLEREVVFGGLNRLRETIEGAIEIMDADAYFVLTGCTAGIIGDDVKSLVAEYQKQGLPVYSVESAGFLGESYRGYEIAFKSLLEHIVKPAEKQNDLVNVLGIMPYHDPFWEGNYEEISRILRGIGLRVNTFVTERQGLNEVRTSSAAALNIIISPWLLKNAEEEYATRFGVPSLRWPGTPVGATDSGRFVRAVAARLDEVSPGQGYAARAETFIESEERYVYGYLETAIGALSWKRFAVVGDANTVVGITRFLANDYSFTPIIAIITDPIFRPEDIERVRSEITTLEYARPPEVIFETDQWNISRRLEAHPEITLLIGSSVDREYAMEHEVQFCALTYPLTDRLIFNRTYSGYRGSLTLIEDLFDNL